MPWHASSRCGGPFVLGVPDAISSPEGFAKQAARAGETVWIPHARRCADGQLTKGAGKDAHPCWGNGQLKAGEGGLRLRDLLPAH